jgi:hypothetical protein
MLATTSVSSVFLYKFADIGKKYRIFAENMRKTCR